MMTKKQGIQKKVIEYIKKHELVQEGERIVLGLSGGADSVCLLLVLMACKEELCFSMEAVHVHHGIRKEADEDVAFVKALCERYNVPCHICYEDVPRYAKEKGLSEEEAGRNVRYQVFRKVLYDGGEKGVIATAHHMNDQAETILFKLFRGSGLHGLCGIRPKNGDIIRPLLCLTKDEIELFLEESGEAYCIDKTNESLMYARNRIRHKILPYATEEICVGSVEHLGKTAEIMQELESFVQIQTEKAFYECVTDVTTGICLLVEKLLQQDIFLQKQLLMYTIVKQTGSKKDITAVHVEDIIKLLYKTGNGSLDLPYGLRVEKEFGKLLFKTDQEERVPSDKRGSLVSEIIPLTNTERCMQVFGSSEIEDILKSIEQKTYTKWFDYDKISEIPTLRNRQKGDYLTIDEKLSHKKLKDYLIQEKIPKDMREKLFLVADGSHIMWIIGRRISSYYKVTTKTKRILVLSYIEESESNIKLTEE